jgi:hypothetical protein
VCALCPRAELRTHVDGGAVAVRRVSSDDNEFLPSVRGQRAECLLSTMFQNQRDGLAKVREALFMRFALTISTRNFRAVRDVPGTVLLNDRREFITHTSLYRCQAAKTMARLNHLAA